MLNVTIPDGVVEGGQFQASTPSGPMPVTVPPGAKSGQVVQISAPVPMVMERTELSDASNAMVGTWTLVSPKRVCCCAGLSDTKVITVSNQVLTMDIESTIRCCGSDCGTSQGSASRGVNDTSITINQSSTFHDVKQIISTYTITSATRDTIEMKCDHWIKKTAGNLNERKHGTMSWDLAAKIMKFRSSGPCARVLTYHKTA